MTFETKDGTITEDEKNLTVIREAVTKTQEGFDGLKGQVDKFEKELKKFGSADILTKEVLEKQTEGLQKSIDDLDASLKAERKEREGLESRMNKSGTSDEAAAIEKKLITMNMTYAAHRKDSAVMSAEDYPHYKSAMNKYLRQGNDALTPEEQKAIRVGSDPSGGYFVMPDETGEVVAFVQEERV